MFVRKKPDKSGSTSVQVIDKRECETWKNGSIPVGLPKAILTAGVTNYLKLEEDVYIRIERKVKANAL